MWRGGFGRYKIEQLYLPTVDHFEPNPRDLLTAVKFIQRFHVSLIVTMSFLGSHLIRLMGGLAEQGGEGLRALQGGPRAVGGGGAVLAGDAEPGRVDTGPQSEDVREAPGAQGPVPAE
jgi:hypothetical protein